MAASRPSILDFLNEVQEFQKTQMEAEQVREILPASVWLNNPYYVGESGKSLYPFWKRSLIDIFETNRGKINEVIVTGSIGTGKSTFGLFCLVRRLYELSCYKRVQRLFDMMPTAILAMVYFSLSQKLAKRSGFAQLSNLIDEIDYFKENFPRSDRIESQLEFPENLLIYSGSSASAVTGMNLIGSLLDEANFFGTAGLGEVQGHEVDYSKVSAMYTAIVNRGQSRFKKAGRDDSLSILISSTTTHSSLTESRIAKALKEGKDSHTKVIVARLWDVKPKGTYSTENFWVFVGSDHLEPQVIHSLGDVETCAMRQISSDLMDQVRGLPLDQAITRVIESFDPSVKNKFYPVPVDFKSAFEKDVVYSIRDILGLSIANMGKLFGSEEIYKASTKDMEGMEKPFLSDEFVLSILDDSSVKNFVNPAFVPENKNVPRYFHYDQSTTTDRTGIAWAYTHHYIESKVEFIDEYGEKQVRVEKRPVICVEGVVTIDPPKPPKKISIRKCRGVIFYLRDSLGLQIGGGSFDQFACLTADNYVITDRGVISIKDVKVGDKVLNDKGWCSVSHTMSYRGAPVYELKTNRNLVLRGTGNHPIRVSRDWLISKEDRGEFERLHPYYKGKGLQRVPRWRWVYLRDLQPGDVIDMRFHRVDYHEGKDPDFSFLGPNVDPMDVAYLIGYALGDGTISKDGFSFVCGSEFELNHLADIIDRVTGKKCLRHKKTDTHYCCNLSSREMMRVLGNYGFVPHRDFEKEIPDSFRGFSTEWLAELVAGYLDSDGSIDKQEKSVRFTSTSLKLLNGIGWIVQHRLGMRWVPGRNESRGSLKEFSNKRFYQTRVSYYAGISGCVDILRGTNSYKIERRTEKGREVFQRVLSVKPSGTETVYNITVDECPHFIANGFYTHNSHESRQEFQEQGIDAGYLSVDRTDEQYLLFVTLLNEGQIMWAYNEVAHKELFNLDHNRFKRRVDHPKGGSKDTMDAVVGAVWNAYQASIQSVGIADARMSLGGIDSDDGEELFPEISRVVRASGTRTSLFDY